MHLQRKHKQFKNGSPGKTYQQKETAVQSEAVLESLIFLQCGNQKEYDPIHQRGRTMFRDGYITLWIAPLQ